MFPEAASSTSNVGVGEKVIIGSVDCLVVNQNSFGSRVDAFDQRRRAKQDWQFGRIEHAHHVRRYSSRNSAMVNAKAIFDRACNGPVLAYIFAQPLGKIR